MEAVSCRVEERRGLGSVADMCLCPQPHGDLGTLPPSEACDLSVPVAVNVLMADQAGNS